MKELDDAMAGLPDPAYAFPGNRPPRRIREAPTAPLAEEWDANPIIMKRKGVDTEFFLIKALCEALGGIKPVTVRSWEAKGWLPKSRFRTPAPSTHPVDGKTPMGKRLYTREQIEAVVKAALDNGVVGPDKVRRPNWTKFTKTVVDSWSSIR